MLLFQGLRGAKFWTVATIAACLATLLGSAIYFQPESPPRFFLEKASLSRDPRWLAAFYFHVVGASVCLVTGTLLMFPQWTLRRPACHHRLGYVYVNTVLWMAAPSGLAMAFMAKGGSLGTAGFALAGVFWWRSTWLGYRAIRQGDLHTHVVAMVQSYAWAWSAPAFRAIQAVLFLLQISDATNYVVSLWLSIAASVWMAQSFLRRHERNPAQFTLKSHSQGALT